MVIWREALIGAGLAIGLMLVLEGVDITPFLFLGALIFGMKYLLDSRMGRQEAVGVAGKSNVNSTVAFDDVGGQEVAKKEFREALDFIRHADQVKAMGIRPLKGILLAGPPGTGKTLLAKAAANYTDAVFLATSGSEFIEMYAGVGAKRVRELFRKARKKALDAKRQTALVFIDEIEVIGGKRGRHQNHMEYDQTLNQLLVEMDGIRGDEDVRVLVVAATNREDLLDSALLRPGRFDRVVRVDLPDKDGRLKILEIHAQGKPLASDLNLESIARETFGFSGAHLENLINEAAIGAMRRGESLIQLHDLREAMEKVMMGERLDRRPRPEELRRVAIHELGHALVSEAVRPGSVANITIQPRGRTLGHMRQTPQDDQYLYTKEEIEAQIAIALGGSLAENLILGNRSTGSQNDFDQAVDWAKRLIFAGLSPLKVVDRETLPPADLHRMTQEVVQKSEEMVEAILGDHIERIEALTETLLKEERIPGEMLRDMLESA